MNNGFTYRVHYVNGSNDLIKLPNKVFSIDLMNFDYSVGVKTPAAPDLTADGLGRAYDQYKEGAITYGEFLTWILANVDNDYNTVGDDSKHADLLERVGEAVKSLKDYQLGMFAGPTD
jgi:hypothetical protein